MNIITKKPKIQALSLEVLKAHLRIEHDHEDSYLKIIIDIATEILENSIEKPILKKEYKYIYYNDEITSSRKIVLPIRLVKEIISVNKIGDNQIEPLQYTVKPEGAKTVLITNGSKYPVEIKYTAGITDDVNEIPEDLIFAILQISKNIYECSDIDILESKYLQHIVNSYKTLSIS